MIISISGLPGSGKSTVGKMLAEKLGYERISAGSVQRHIAEQKGISIMELLKQEEVDSSIDEEVDNYVADLGRKKDDFVIEGRIAFHFIPDSLKVFIKVDLGEGAKRVFKDLDKEERSEEDKANSAANLQKMLEQREAVDKERYQKYYGIDYTDSSNYDLVVDSTDITPDEVADKIMVEVEKRKEEEESGEKAKDEEEIL